jgi:hypothetical protein
MPITRSVAWRGVSRQVPCFDCSARKRRRYLSPDNTSVNGVRHSGCESDWLWPDRGSSTPTSSASLEAERIPRLAAVPSAGPQPLAGAQLARGCREAGSGSERGFPARELGRRSRQRGRWCWWSCGHCRLLEGFFGPAGESVSSARTLSASRDISVSRLLMSTQSGWGCSRGEERLGCITGAPSTLVCHAPGTSVRRGVVWSSTSDSRRAHVRSPEGG